MTPSEARMLELKYTGKRIAQMESDELNLSTRKMLINISVITGWTLPPNEVYLNLFVDQLLQKMKEAYGSITEAEIEYAFRNKPSDVKDWGKPINLAMIDDVIRPFLQQRFELSEQEQQFSNQLLQLPTSSKVLDDAEWQEWLEDIAKYEINKIPCDSYDYLERKGELLLSKYQKHDYMARSIAHVAGILDPLSREYIEFCRMRSEGVYSADMTNTLITHSKRLAVYDCLNSQKD